MLSSVSQRNWTVLYYFNGNNDLQPNLVKNLIDLEKVGSTDQVTIVAQLSRAPEKKKSGLDGGWTGMRRYEVGPGKGRSKIYSKPVYTQDQSPNHGDSQTLADFLQWGMKNYPAKHTMVVIGDHGKGFVGTGFDYLHKDVLNLQEFKTALKDSRPDILMMDACEMAAVEVAYQLKDSAKILVASEEIIGNIGLPHKDFLNFLINNPKKSPQQLARDLVDFSAADTAYRVGKGMSSSAEQLSAIRLDRMQEVVTTLSELGHCLAESQIPRARLKELIENTQHFNADCEEKPDEDFRDILDFCRQLQEEGGQVKQVANKVEKALKRAIINNHCQGEDIFEGNGLSVYLPPAPIKSMPRVKSPNGKRALPQLNYQDLDFDKATGWSSFLAKCFKPKAS